MHNDMNIFATKQYNDRMGRNLYASELIENHFKSTNSVLNVGGGAANYLKSTMPNRDVIAIDIDSKADIQFDLDSENPIPFGADKPDLIVALDVLEHLEKFHERLNEILEITTRGALLSLPISSSETARILLRPNAYRRQKRTEATFSKYYGIPLEKPHDRHRWYIYGTDIITLAESLEDKGYEVHIGLDAFFKSKLLSKLVIRICSKHLLLNLLSKWVWIVIKKPLPSGKKPQENS